MELTFGIFGVLSWVFGIFWYFSSVSVSVFENIRYHKNIGFLHFAANSSINTFRRDVGRYIENIAISPISILSYHIGIGLLNIDVFRYIVSYQLKLKYQ